MNLDHHDAQVGPLTRCQISGSDDLHLIIDLGSQPPCDALLTSLDQPEMHYPLSLWLCPDSGLAQLDYVVDGEEIYPPAYPYRSGISKPLEEYQRAFADRVLQKFPCSLPNPLVVDIGSNDGTLLTGFKRRGWRALGVEPTDVAKIAQDENGIVTVQEFFSEDLAKDIICNHGHPQLVTMTNVFAHMAPLGEVMRGIVRLLKDGAVFISESHYLLDVLDKYQFDTIYHEHIRTYSLRALCLLAGQYGLEVFDVERGDRYGGNIRVYIARKGTHAVEQAVGDLLNAEAAAGLFDPTVWMHWRGRVLENRDRTMEMLYTEHREGRTIRGCSAPGRAATLINFYGIPRDLLLYTGELHNSLKLDKFLPGSHLPVLRNTNLITEQPDYIILFAWHYAAAVRTRLRSEGIKARLIQPLPMLQIMED